MVLQVFRGLAAALMLAAAWPSAADPLPSWRDGANKQRILEFVTAVTTPGGSGYITPADRIAVFDDDGTLWPEKPRPQGMLALQRLRAQAPAHPEWRNLMPYRGALELGSKYLAEARDQDVLLLLATAFAGMTQEEFRREVRRFYQDATHPRWGVPYVRLGYQPMRELIAHLRANGFRVFVVTTGSLDVVREVVEDGLGLPATDVIGSSVVTTLREEGGRLVVRRLKTVHAFNDGDTKALSIDFHLGRRPLLAVGNVGSGGDLSMLRFSQDGDPGRPSLQLLVFHDDFEREYAYDEADRASLNAAERNGWLVVSMRYEWKRLFGFEEPPAPPTGTPVAGTPGTP